MIPTAPMYFTAVCVNCEAHRTFKLTGGDTDDAFAEYECEDCGQPANLNLDP